MPMKDMRMSQTPCECGCGEYPLRNRKWVKGHRPLKPTRQGYIRVWDRTHPLANGDGNVLLHRKVLYDAGITVPAGAHVHHLNGDKTDNRLENLAVLTPSAHQKTHALVRGYVDNQYGRWPVRSER